MPLNRVGKLDTGALSPPLTPCEWEGAQLEEVGGQSPGVICPGQAPAPCPAHVPAQQGRQCRLPLQHGGISLLLLCLNYLPAQAARSMETAGVSILGNSYSDYIITCYETVIRKEPQGQLFFFLTMKSDHHSCEMANRPSFTLLCLVRVGP